MITALGTTLPRHAPITRSCSPALDSRGPSVEAPDPATQLGKTAPQLYAHRGARGLIAENTLEGYKLALRMGADFIDMDVVMTADHEVVVGHDPVLNPAIAKGPDGKFVEPGRWVVGHMKFSELGQFDVGSLNPEHAYGQVFPDQKPVPGAHMPTLREVIRYAKSVTGDRMMYQVEVKNDPARPELTPSPRELAAGVARVLEEEGVAERTEVQAFDFAVLQELQKINPRIPTQYLTEVASFQQMTDPDPKVATTWTGGKLLKDYGNSIPRMIKELGGRVWGPQDTEVTAEQVKEAHALGLKVVVWSWPDDPSHPVPADTRTEGIEMAIDKGVDGLIHDRPDVVLDVFRKRGLPTPQAYPDAALTETH